MCDVLIIGGGISAIVAAERLTQLGASWKILEARGRLGGRIWSLANGVELGAEFVHGSRAVTWDYVHKADLECDPYPSDKDTGRLYAYDGQFVDDPSFPGKVEELFSKLEGYRGPDISVDKAIEKVGEKYDSRTVFFALDRIARLEGADTSKLSAKSLGIERCLNTAGWDNYRIRGGYQRLIDSFSLAQDVILNAPVSRLEWGKAGVRAYTDKGMIAEARHALITVPLSVLKRGLIEFCPALPAAKNRAISGLEMGDVTKIILSFSSPVSPPFSYLSTNGLVRVWWRNESNGCPVLTGYTGGQLEASELASLGLKAADRGAEELAKLFGQDVRDRLVKGQVINWADEPWIWGAYSYTPVGALHHRDALASPLRPALYFAGEATSTTGHVGTVTGAIESGLKAVSEIIRT